MIRNPQSDTETIVWQKSVLFVKNVPCAVINNNNNKAGDNIVAPWMQEGSTVVYYV